MEAPARDEWFYLSSRILAISSNGKQSSRLLPLCRWLHKLQFSMHRQGSLIPNMNIRRAIIRINNIFTDIYFQVSGKILLQHPLRPPTRRYPLRSSLLDREFQKKYHFDDLTYLREYHHGDRIQ